MTDAQFEQLIGMLAENRVEFRASLAEIKSEVQDIRKGMTLLQVSSDVIEADLNKVQVRLRYQAETLQKQEQALDGLTQLGKTNFDMNQSILKFIHGKSSNSHDQSDEIQGAGP